MRLTKLELREIRMPLLAPFTTSFGTTEARRILIVKVFDESGATGFGECVAMEGPFYNAETVDSASLIIMNHLCPLLHSRSIYAACDVRDAFLPIRGNEMAKAAVETALWDMDAKVRSQPLWQHLGGSRSEINCGVSIGLQATVEDLLERVGRELAAGYQRIKIKVEPGRDVALVKAVREKFGDILLSVDANSAYSLIKDLPTLQELDQFGLLMIEQPLASGDLVEHAKLQKQIATPICLDESIVNLRTAQHAHELGACRIINIKIGRVGGHQEAIEIQRFAEAHGIRVWCGGMLESGIGRAHNIAISTLSGFNLPGDVSASARYWKEDIIDPPVTVSHRGTIAAPSGAGIGFTVNEERLESLTVLRDEFLVEDRTMIALSQK